MPEMPARGTTSQPNIDGGQGPEPRLRFWLAVVLVGIGAGLCAAGLMLLLHAVQHLAFAYRHGDFQAATARVSRLRRFLAPTIAGVVTGVAWFVLRRTLKNDHARLDDALWKDSGELSFRRSLGTSVLSEVAVGAGASLGREAAPKLLGAASASLVAGWWKLTTAERRLLVACGAGAGMGAVYNVPLGGALMAAELLYGGITLRVILPALACSWIATTVSWIYLPIAPTYRDVPSYSLHAPHIAFAVIFGPLIGLIAVAYVRLVGLASLHRAHGRQLIWAPALAFAILGAVAAAFPQLLGNGKGVAHNCFVGVEQPLGIVAALFLLKPVVTVLCFGSGATGGLFTPTLSTGALLGELVGRLWSRLWPGAPTGSYAVIGATAMIGASMQAPLAALALVIELTHTVDTLIVPMIAATMLATTVSHYVDGASIYSARLRTHSP